MSSYVSLCCITRPSRKYMYTHTHTLAVSLCKYGIFKLDSTNKGMAASYYILYVCVCVCVCVRVCAIFE
jgi:hypothetical protein